MAVEPDIVTSIVGRDEFEAKIDEAVAAISAGAGDFFARWSQGRRR